MSSHYSFLCVFPPILAGKKGKAISWMTVMHRCRSTTNTYNICDNDNNKNYYNYNRSRKSKSNNSRNCSSSTPVPSRSRSKFRTIPYSPGIA